MASLAAARFSVGLGDLFLTGDPYLQSAACLVDHKLLGDFLIGGAIAWGGLAPWLLKTGIVSEAGFGPLVTKLLWPGVALMIAASLTSVKR